MITMIIALSCEIWVALTTVLAVLGRHGTAVGVAACGAAIAGAWVYAVVLLRRPAGPSDPEGQI
jgi:hypothetical protein